MRTAEMSASLPTVSEPMSLSSANARALRSARALGLDASIGSLAVGKLADITAVRMDEIETSPCYDPHSHLVYASGREHVSHVWVNGKLLLNERVLTTLDAHEIIARAAYWQDRIGKS